MKWMLYSIGKYNVKLIATLTLYYYKKMKSVEEKFRLCKSLLLAMSKPSDEIKTLYGLAKISTIRQATLDNDKLLEHVDHKKLLEMSTIRVNLVMKHLGNRFDAVVKNWHDDKQVQFIMKK